MTPHREDGVPDAASAKWWEVALVALVSLIALWATIVYYDNVHRATMNGLWKSIDVRLWVEHSPARATNSANLLYYPVIGAMVRLLPETVFGTVWQRMAYVNGIFGAAIVALTYLMALRLFRSRSIALFTCLAQVAMGFFLLLSTINEDIMPGYFWFVAAVATVVLARRLTTVVVILTAQCVALAWLFHSSLQLPSIGAFVVGILAWEGSIRSIRRAASRVLLFCLALLPLPIVSAFAFKVGRFYAGTRFIDVHKIYLVLQGLWSGKFIGSGWGGFSINKLVMLWSGTAESVVGGENIPTITGVLAYPNVVVTFVTSVVLACMLGVWLWTGWNQRKRAEWRLTVAILFAVFLLAEGMNLYVQPQDPQMQIQPMTWFPFAAACLYSLVRRFGRAGAQVAHAVLVAGMVMVAVGNLRVYAQSRHLDSVAVGNVRLVEALAPPERTLFLMHGYEAGGMGTWLTAAWGPGTELPDPDGPAVGRFNVVFMVNEATVTPDRPPAESARNQVRLVEHALNAGFDVVASDIWAAPAASWVDGFATVSGPDKPLAIHAALHERFIGTLIGEAPGWTRLYRITRKPGVAAIP